MAQERKVKAVMTAAGLYKEGSKEALRSDFIAEEEVTIAGKSYTLSKISFLDAKIFTDELDTILVQQNPLIHEIYAKNAVTLFDAVRMVNVNTKQGFKGALASGNELDFTLIMARQLQDPDTGVGRRTTWIRTITPAMVAACLAGTPESFLELDAAPTTPPSEELMLEEEGMVWLAFYNPAVTPCIDAFQIQMNTEPFDVQSLDFDQVHLQTGDVIVELKEPWTLPPEQAGLINVYYFRAGTDETRPLGIFIKQAKALRQLWSV